MYTSMSEHKYRFSEFREQHKVFLICLCKVFKHDLIQFNMLAFLQTMTSSNFAVRHYFLQLSLKYIQEESFIHIFCFNNIQIEMGVMTRVFKLMT